MKKFLIVFFLTLSVLSFGQSPFRGFFKPVPKSIQTVDGSIKADASNYWLFRPMVTISAMQFTFGDPVMVQSFSSLGTGITYSHFITQNSEPYANFGANLMVLFTQDINALEPAKLSVAGTVSILQYLNFGGGYSFSSGKLFLLTGVQYNFN
jgi:hypothetical protein